MKITALIENKESDQFVGEHGLAVHIEYNGMQYLLDSGASGKFISNADKMNVDLAKVDVAILSHNHYDHAGGYAEFFERNSTASVYLRETIDANCYYKIGPFKKYIGIPKRILEKHRTRFILAEGDYRMAEGVWLIPHKTDKLEKIGRKSHMYRKVGQRLKYDDFVHEQSLVFETENGLIVLNSCCHGGVDTIVKEIRSTFPNRNVLAVIGGFHLMGARGTNSFSGTKEEIRLLAERLRALGVAYIYTGHCTGNPAFSIMKDVLRDQIHYFSTGMQLEF